MKITTVLMGLLFSLVSLSATAEEKSNSVSTFVVQGFGYWNIDDDLGPAQAILQAQQQAEAVAAAQCNGKAARVSDWTQSGYTTGWSGGVTESATFKCQ